MIVLTDKLRILIYLFLKEDNTFFIVLTNALT